MIGGLLGFVVRYATVLLAGGLLAGLAVPDVARLMRPHLTPIVWMLLFVSMMRVDWQGVLGHIRAPLRVALAMVFFLGVMPVAVWWLLKDSGLAPPLLAAIVLMALAPPLMSAPALAQILGLDAALAMVLMVVSTLLVPFVLPVMALQVLGLDLGVGTLELMARLGGLIGSGVAAAMLVRRALGGARLAALGRTLDGLSVLLLLAFAVAVMDGMGPLIAGEPWKMAWIAALSFVANLGFQMLGAAAFAPLGWRVALTIGLAHGNRALAVLLAVLPADAARDTLLFFILGQLPIYMLPAALAPVYRRLTGPGRKPATAPPGGKAE